jgi:hypothetical protein
MSLPGPNDIWAAWWIKRRYDHGCSARGSVVGSNNQIAALAGYTGGTFIGSSVTGSVTGAYSNGVEGLVGCNKGGTITECYEQEMSMHLCTGWRPCGLNETE